jgi:antitoxin HicB
MTKAKKNPHIGSSLDDFLKDEGIYDEVTSLVIKEKIAFQLKQRMTAKKISINGMAKAMKTSRTQIHRLLDPANGNVTLATLQKAAAMVGRKVRLELV